MLNEDAIEMETVRNYFNKLVTKNSPNKTLEGSVVANLLSSKHKAKVEAKKKEAIAADVSLLEKSLEKEQILAGTKEVS